MVVVTLYAVGVPFILAVGLMIGLLIKPWYTVTVSRLKARLSRRTDKRVEHMAAANANRLAAAQLQARHALDNGRFTYCVELVAAILCGLYAGAFWSIYSQVSLGLYGSWLVFMALFGYSFARRQWPGRYGPQGPGGLRWAQPGRIPLSQQAVTGEISAADEAATWLETCDLLREHPWPWRCEQDADRAVIIASDGEIVQMAYPATLGESMLAVAERCHEELRRMHLL
jgi:hypothetical protein